MRIGREEIGRHRRGDNGKGGGSFFWLLLPLLLFFVYLGFAEQDLLRKYARGIRAEIVRVVDLSKQASADKASQAAETEGDLEQPRQDAASPNPSEAKVSQSQGQQDRIGRLEAAINSQKEGMENLTKEVRYIGSIMRQLSSSVKAGAQQRSSLAARLEKMDTTAQAFTEASLTDRTQLQDAVTELQEIFTTLESNNNRNQRVMGEIEETISSLNARLIELEK